MTVLHDGQASIVGLHGLCAPELSQSYGEEAAVYPWARIEGWEVMVRAHDRDRFGRLVARVFRGGHQVNRQLLRAGFAWYYWWYDQYTQEAAQDQALSF